MSKPKVSVISGDITRTPADVLITAINSGGDWDGYIDDAIKLARGDFFHNKAEQAMPLRDGQTVVARSSSNYGKRNSYRDVLFVVDDLQRSLGEIIYIGLKAASDAGYKSVSLPTIRLGVMLGKVEKSREEALVEMSVGVRSFIKKNPVTSIENITFVVYNDKDTETRLRGHLPDQD